ncbi:hypothetical protein HMPREF0083_02379 [Aneurinibacillus aneurinilyticus ATCC 12856]|uniref:Uncharacterized protein n=1 Tax=Aneurinibacillus aneurinilyticus ATCC 12856 TaxID=649747 RepID=U1X4R8_ANEAE|nr:hypothetical protein HMPREF0083_02379 [Aneurinibacillus aneurinilyticus ATCC 12856]
MVMRNFLLFRKFIAFPPFSQEKVGKDKSRYLFVDGSDYTTLLYACPLLFITLCEHLYHGINRRPIFIDSAHFKILQANISATKLN